MDRWNPAFIARTASRVMWGLHCSEPAGLAEAHCFRVVQKRVGSTMNVLFLGLIDYPCRVEAVSLYEHESRRRGVLDRKN